LDQGASLPRRALRAFNDREQQPMLDNSLPNYIFNAAINAPIDSKRLENIKVVIYIFTCPLISREVLSLANRSESRRKMGLPAGVSFSRREFRNLEAAGRGHD
jgi:hypothetical protein